MLYLMFRWLFVTEEDIKGLPCFQVSLSNMEVIGKEFEFLNLEMLLRFLIVVSISCITRMKLL